MFRVIQDLHEYHRNPTIKTIGDCININKIAILNTASKLVSIYKNNGGKIYRPQQIINALSVMLVECINLGRWYNKEYSHLDVSLDANIYHSDLDTLFDKREALGIKIYSEENRANYKKYRAFCDKHEITYASMRKCLEILQYFDIIELDRKGKLYNYVEGTYIEEGRLRFSDKETFNKRKKSLSDVIEYKAGNCEFKEDDELFKKHLHVDRESIISELHNMNESFHDNNPEGGGYLTRYKVRDIKYWGITKYLHIILGIPDDMTLKSANLLSKTKRKKMLSKLKDYGKIIYSLYSILPSNMNKNYNSEYAYFEPTLSYISSRKHKHKFGDNVYDKKTIIMVSWDSKKKCYEKVHKKLHHRDICSDSILEEIEFINKSELYRNKGYLQYTRVFFNNELNCGRFYNQFASLPKELRNRIMKYNNYKEIDFTAMMINILYASITNKTYDGDPYLAIFEELGLVDLIKNLDLTRSEKKRLLKCFRKIAKEIIIPLNNTYSEGKFLTHVKRILSTYGINLTKELVFKTEYDRNEYFAKIRKRFLAKGFNFSNYSDDVFQLVFGIIPEDLVEAIKKAHAPISDTFFSMNFQTTQFIESEITRNSILKSIERNELIYTVHDAVFVSEDTIDFWKNYVNKEFDRQIQLENEGRSLLRSKTEFEKLTDENIIKDVISVRDTFFNDKSSENSIISIINYKNLPKKQISFVIESILKSKLENLLIKTKKINKNYIYFNRHMLKDTLNQIMTYFGYLIEKEVLNMVLSIKKTLKNIYKKNNNYNLNNNNKNHNKLTITLCYIIRNLITFYILKIRKYGDFAFT